MLIKVGDAEMRSSWRKEPVLGFEFETRNGGIKLRGENGRKGRWIHYCQTVVLKEQSMAPYWKDAVYWYKKAALHNEPLAIKMLQQIVDYYYIRKRALKGDAEAQYLLSAYCVYAYGTYQDFDSGTYWFKEAARNGSESALESIKRHNQLFGVNLTLGDPDFFAVPCFLPEEIINSDMKKRHGKYRSKLVQETIMEPVWKQYSGVDFKEAEAEAKAGNAEMQYALAWLYDWGLGVTQDLGEAFKWFTEAAFNQYAPAQTELGILYQFGILARKTDLEMFDGKERMFG